jgi:D-alanyl-lipoteichoic acid acyltransferase DltB (MBOAT superfamily)
VLFSDPVFFFLFLPVAVIVFRWVAQAAGATAALGALLAFSCLFYGGWGTDYLLVLIASICVNWMCAQALLSLGDAAATSRRLVFYAGQAINFGALIWFKYSFVLMNFVHGGVTVNAAALAIPVGISFYTFQQAVFLSDAFRRDPSVVQYLCHSANRQDRLRGFIRYAGFVCFFPQLVIGPIVYLKEFAPQVTERGFGRITARNLEIGLLLFVVGLFKKVVLADNLGLIADPVFQNAAQGQAASMVSAWAGALSYYTQLYFDFSGYSDMALGAARIFGIVLPMNFDSPLKAVGIMDFYRRWHITLTRVIARFLYTPISLWGARLGMLRLERWPVQKLLSSWLPLFLNFLVIALWHGATQTFLVFGIVHGLWYILESEARGTRLWKRWKSNTSDRLRASLGRLIFFVPMVLCFSLFRADSLEAWSLVASSMFGGHGMATSPLTAGDLLRLGIAGGALCFVWFLPNVYELARDHEPGIATWQNKSYTWARWPTWRPSLAWGAVMGGGMLIALYFIGRLPPFLYMGF